MKGAIRRLIRNHGTTLEHYKFDAGTETSRGQAFSVAADAPEIINAIPDPGSRSLGFGAFGSEVEADMLFLVGSDVDLTDGGGEGASRLKHHGDVYVVVDADQSYQYRGFQLIHCDRDTESDL
jgi:hypothetical protein